MGDSLHGQWVCLALRWTLRWGEVGDSALRPCSGKQNHACMRYACRYGMLARAYIFMEELTSRPSQTQNHSMWAVWLVGSCSSVLLSCLDCCSTELICSTELRMLVLFFCRIRACA